MKRHGGLFDRIPQFDNLLQAARRAARGKRDRPTVARFEFHLEPELLALKDDLQTLAYQPGVFFTFEVRDPKRRRICAAPFRDRVVHHAICNVLNPIFESRLIADTYACRKGKGSHAAMRRAQHFSRRYPYVLKWDIRKYFENIDHHALQTLMARLFKEPRLLTLLSRIIHHAPPQSLPGKGVPIGNLTSQHFANLYLGELDHFLKERLRIKGYLRYMDDGLLFAEDKPTLYLWLAEIRQFLRERLQLELKEEVTRVAPVSDGIPFLGFRIYPGVIRLDHRSLHRFRRRVRGWETAYWKGTVSMEELAPSVASLYAHVAHADTLHLRRRTAAKSLVRG